MDKTIIAAVFLKDFHGKPIKWAALFSAKVLIWAGWISACIIGIFVSKSPGFTIFLQFMLGAAYAHGVELQHQALHLSGLRSKTSSRVFGILLGLPMLVSYSAYQDSHLFHHQALGKPEDTEFFEYGDKTDRQIVPVVKHFFLINHFCEFLKNVIDALNGRHFQTRLLAKNSRKMRIEYLLIAFVFFGCGLVAFYADSKLFIKCWIVPLFLFAAPIHALIELPEHFSCDKSSTNVFENTRTVKTHPLVTWFTNGNNYHVEHHWLAALPIEQLASVHKQIEGQIVHLSSSYFSFYRKFFASLLFGNRAARSSQGL